MNKSACLRQLWLQQHFDWVAPTANYPALSVVSDQPLFLVTCTLEAGVI